jgi:hypothetical protein
LQVQEQITRVLLERLIVNRPHPWGLLITFIELIKNERYNFWGHAFVHCAAEIERLFESVARSCMSSAAKAEDDLGGLQARCPKSTCQWPAGIAKLPGDATHLVMSKVLTACVEKACLHKRATD